MNLLRIFSYLNIVHQSDYITFTMIFYREHAFWQYEDQGGLVPAILLWQNSPCEHVFL